MKKKKTLWPPIVPRKNASGEITSYMLDLGQARWSKGRRLRPSFKTLAEAETAAAQYRTSRKNEELSSYALDTAQRYDASQALDILRPYNWTLLEAAKFSVAHLEESTRSRPVTEVVEELLEKKKRANRSPQNLASLTWFLGKFALDFGDRPICDISAREIEDWLDKCKVSEVSHNTYRAWVSVLFHFAKRRNYLRDNPIKDVPSLTANRGRPEFLSIDEARALLWAADADLAPVIALGLFGGLRPESETLHLSWSHIQMDERLIDISRSKNTNSQRFVPISDVLAAWLLPYIRTTGPVFPASKVNNFHNYLRRLRAYAAATLKIEGIEAPHLINWPPDAMRHSFATYHVATYGNAYQTAELMGHGTNVTILKRHYQGRIQPSLALPYWQLNPPLLLPAPGEKGPFNRYEGEHRAAYDSLIKQIRSRRFKTTKISSFIAELVS